MTAVAIAKVAAVSAYGGAAAGLGRALAEQAALVGMPAEQPLANPRARKLMSRGAYLAARCLADLLRDAGWAEGRERIGYFLGVGASGGSLDDVTALLGASVVDGELSLERFGDRGLAACNPLLAFQLMNNFTMCHGAILEGLGGPNSALFSRGAGTVAAIAEAVHAVRSGDCDRAIAGGADAATHPVTIAELARDGFLARGLVPADGAGLLALSSAQAPDSIVVEGCAFASGRGRATHDALADVLASLDRGQTSSGYTATPPIDARSNGSAAPVDTIVIAPWGPPTDDTLRSFVASRYPSARVVTTAPLGDTLAASAALAVIAGVDLLADASARRVLVLTLGIDGDPGAMALSRGAG